ncbi:hypothetical protein AAKU52_000758 [Pedobacter sp. CG_S7]
MVYPNFFKPYTTSVSVSSFMLNIQFVERSFNRLVLFRNLTSFDLVVIGAPGDAGNLQ